MRIEFDFYGERVNREILLTGERAVRARPAMRAVSDKVSDITKAQFRTRGGRSGNPWEPLKKRTRQRKRARGHRGAPLRATDRMYRSLISKRNTGDAIRTVTDDSLTYGTRVPYFKFHQSRRPRSVIPRRPVFDFTEPDKRDIVRIIQRWIVTGTVS